MAQKMIEAQALGKRYALRTVGRYGTLRDSLAGLMSLRNWSGSRRCVANSVWALRDATFSLEQGEVVGLIGANGAGKSTLLRILSQITAPTSGRVDLYGRVGSLLEVGTGFHPELSGRENVFLNGAILGMSSGEVRSNLDSIVSFAGVDRFIDVPVKFYSSGMYLRLAFAVAVHFRPEILLVDEVLAVGDAEFQRKCFAKLQEIGAGGRTIVLVSHNLSAIRHTCQRAIALENGTVVDDGKVDSVVDRYLARVSAESDVRAVGTASFVVEEVSVRPLDSYAIKTFSDVEFRVRVRANCPVETPGLYMGILSLEYERLAGLDVRDFVSPPPLAAGAVLTVRVQVQRLPLMPGGYWLELHVKDTGTGAVEVVPGYFPFEVVDSAVYGARRVDHWFGRVGLRAAVSLETGAFK